MTGQLSGVIANIFPEETFGNFTKRVFWLKQINVQYPMHYALELWYDDIEALKKFKVGEGVICEVEVRGNKWSKNGREGVMNILKCTGISKL